MTKDSDNSSCELENSFRVYRQLHRSRGWQVRFNVNGTMYWKYFPDAAYGSAKEARQAAEQFAWENKELHRELLDLRRRFEVRSNSRSGIPGVARYAGYGKRGPFWLAYWDNEKGRRVSRRFSIRRLGETKAFQVALETREKGVRRYRERYEEVLASLAVDAETRE